MHVPVSRVSCPAKLSTADNHLQLFLIAKELDQICCQDCFLHKRQGLQHMKAGGNNIAAACVFMSYSSLPSCTLLLREERMECVHRFEEWQSSD